MSDLVRVVDYVLSFVAKQGVKHVFLVTGGGAMYLNDALAQNKDLQFVPNHHEQASAVAAEAYARINGRLGVAMVTTGPGSTNAITGVVGAWIDSVPVLIISGQVKRADLMGESGVRQKGPQEVDIISMVSHVTKYAVTVMEPNSIRFHLEKAIDLATSGRRGPVWVSIPLDVQASLIDPSQLEPYNATAPIMHDHLKQQVSEVIDLINQSKRPLLLAGQGVRLAQAADAFSKLYEALNIPVATTWSAMDMIPANHRLSVGKPGVFAQRPPNFAVQNSDLLITIGARLDNVVTAFNPTNFGRQAIKVIVDVDSSELAKFDMPNKKTICADARHFIEALLENKDKVKQIDRSDWHDRIQVWKARYPMGDGKPLAAEGPISHYDFARALSDAISENTLIVTGSSGLAIEIFYNNFETKLGQRIFSTTGLGAMGFALPAMIGAFMASSGKQFVGIESDGSLQVNIQELSTIRAFDIPVCLFVMNNKGYASIRTTQRNYFQGRSIGTGPDSKLFLPDIVGIAKVIGIPAIRISDASELKEKLGFVLNQKGPFICDVELVSDESLWPKCIAIPQADGSMISMPLEDMSPLLSREELCENMLIPLDPASEKVRREPVKKP